MDMEDIQCFNNTLQDLFHAKLLQFCSECIHWNEELVLQFYATLYVSGNHMDITTWVLEWMTEHQNYSMTFPEAIVILELPQCTSSTAYTYGYPILYLPSTLYRI